MPVQAATYSYYPASVVGLSTFSTAATSAALGQQATLLASAGSSASMGAGVHKYEQVTGVSGGAVSLSSSPTAVSAGGFKYDASASGAGAGVLKYEATALGGNVGAPLVSASSSFSASSGGAVGVGHLGAADLSGAPSHASAANSYDSLVKATLGGEQAVHEAPSGSRASLMSSAGASASTSLPVFLSMSSAPSAAGLRMTLPGAGAASAVSAAGLEQQRTASR